MQEENKELLKAILDELKELKAGQKAMDDRLNALEETVDVRLNAMRRRLDDIEAGQRYLEDGRESLKEGLHAACEYWKKENISSANSEGVSETVDEKQGKLKIIK